MNLALTPIQPPAVFEAIRDGRPAYLYLPPTKCPKCKGYRLGFKNSADGKTRYMSGLCERCGGTGTASPSLPDQPCPECDGTGIITVGFLGRYVCKCGGSGWVLLPLLIPGWQRPTLTLGGDKVVSGWQLTNEHGGRHWPTRRVAGLAVVDRPVPLTVVAHTATPLPSSPFVMHYPADEYGADRDRLWLWRSWDDEEEDYDDITDHFPTPPEPGGVVVDLSGARWLPEPVTEMVTACELATSRDSCPPYGYDLGCDGCRGDDTRSAPLSPGSGQLTIVEVAE